MNFHSKKCFFCKQDLLQNLMILMNPLCPCVFHQDCITNFVTQNQPENLNKCPQCGIGQQPKIQTLKVHFQAELNSQREELSVDQIAQEYEQQTQIIKERAQEFKQRIFQLSEDTKKTRAEIQQLESQYENVKTQIQQFQSLNNCPQKSKNLKDKLMEKVEELNMLQEEKKMYEKLYESYYNDSDIDYQREILNFHEIDNDVKAEFQNNMKKIQELRAELKKKNVENIGRQIIRTNFQFPPLNEEQLAFINSQL
ncbi:hypothetical protein pb186bvf_013007 [Paramecium bursaria]